MYYWLLLRFIKGETDVHDGTYTAKGLVSGTE